MTARILALPALGAALCAGFGTAAAAPWQSASAAWKIAAIHAAGSERFEQGEIARATGLAAGSTVSSEALQAAAQRLASTGAFSKVSFRYGPGGGGIVVTFEVEDAAQFLPCLFANFIWVPDRDILEQLRRRVPLFEGQVSTAGEMGERVDRALEAILKERGVIAAVDHEYYQASMRAPISAVVFKAHGPSLPIHEVAFTGTRAVDADTLAGTVKTLIGQEFDRVFDESFFKATTGDAYRERGYLRVSFDTPQPALLTPGAVSGPVDITEAVNDGLQYNLGSIAWQGNAAFAASDLAGRVSLAPGKPVNALRLDADLGDISTLYGTRGYLTAHAEPTPTFDDSTRTVNYLVVVTEGDQYHMGELHVLGLDPDHIELLRRDCKLRAGDVFDQSYWKHFIADNVRDLPAAAQGRRVSVSTVVNPTAKTVDVTVHFAAPAAK